MHEHIPGGIVLYHVPFTWKVAIWLSPLSLYLFSTPIIHYSCIFLHSLQSSHALPPLHCSSWLFHIGNGDDFISQSSWRGGTEEKNCEKRSRKKEQKRHNILLLLTLRLLFGLGLLIYLSVGEDRVEDVRRPLFMKRERKGRERR